MQPDSWQSSRCVWPKKYFTNWRKAAWMAFGGCSVHHRRRYNLHCVSLIESEPGGNNRLFFIVMAPPVCFNLALKQDDAATGGLTRWPWSEACPDDCIAGNLCAVRPFFFHRSSLLHHTKPQKSGPRYPIGGWVGVWASWGMPYQQCSSSKSTHRVKIPKFWPVRLWYLGENGCLQVWLQMFFFLFLGRFHHQFLFSSRSVAIFFFKLFLMEFRPEMMCGCKYNIQTGF